MPYLRICSIAASALASMYCCWDADIAIVYDITCVTHVTCVTQKGEGNLSHSLTPGVTVSDEHHDVVSVPRS